MLQASHLRPSANPSFVLSLPDCRLSRTRLPMIGLGAFLMAGALIATAMPVSAQGRGVGGFHPGGGHGAAVFAPNRFFGARQAGFDRRSVGQFRGHGVRHGGSFASYSANVPKFGGDNGAGYRGFGTSGRAKFGGFGSYGYGYGGYGTQGYAVNAGQSRGYEQAPDSRMSFDRMPASTGIARAPAGEPLIIRIGGRGARYSTAERRAHRSTPRVLQVGDAAVGTDRNGVLVAGGSKIIVLR